MIVAAFTVLILAMWITDKITRSIRGGGLRRRLERPDASDGFPCGVVEDPNPTDRSRPETHS